MRVRLNSTFANAEGAGAPGSVIDVSEELAKRLVEQGAASLVDTPESTSADDETAPETAAADDETGVETATRPKQRGRQGSRSQGAR